MLGGCVVLAVLGTLMRGLLRVTECRCGDGLGGVVRASVGGLRPTPIAYSRQYFKMQVTRAGS